MASNSSIAAIAFIALILGGAGLILGSRPQVVSPAASSSGSNPEVASSPAACAAHNWMTNQIESALGVLTPTCTQPALTDLKDYATPQVLASNVPMSTSTPAIVQNTFNTATSGTTIVKAFGSNLGSKNTILVCEGESSTTTALVAPTDTLALSYTSVASQAVADVSQCWEAMSNGGGADTVTGNYGATCTATLVCVLFINEFSGTDIVAQTGNAINGAAATTFNCGTGTNGATVIAYPNTPLLLAFYIKTTAGTDTAGANFNLLNGESGSLKYLSEFSTVAGTQQTNYPATVGTSSIWGCVSLIVRPATQPFSFSLNANTNYIFTCQMQFPQLSTSNGMWIHQLDSGATLLQARYFGVILTSPSSGSTSSTDASFFTGITNGIVATISGSVTVGNTPTTLIIEDAPLQLATGATFTVSKGSSCQIWQY